MPSFIPFIILSLSALLPFLFSLTPLLHYTPQFVALVIIICLFAYRPRSLLQNHFELFVILSLIINLLVFATGGLSSPLFFLIYFLLFALSAQNPPSLIMGYSIVLIITLSNSLNSPQTTIELASLLFVSPLAFYIGKLYLHSQSLQSTISAEETNFLMWLNLKFKPSISDLVDHVSQLLSSPQLTPPQKDLLKKIRSNARNLRNSSDKLTTEISSDSNDEEL